MHDASTVRWFAQPPRAGDLVRVRTREEILATLDERGCLDGMPFMPEMLDYCGKTLRVFKRAHKTCDTTGCYGGLRRLEHMVHLEDARCSGHAHGGCQAACMLFWNEAWLVQLHGGMEAPSQPRQEPLSQPAGCSVENLAAATQQGLDPEKGPRYVCQATELPKATKPLSTLDPRTYIEDYRSGNVTLGAMAKGGIYRIGMFAVRPWQGLGRRLGLGDQLAKPLMATYDAVAACVPNGVPYPRRYGTVPQGQPTPTEDAQWLRPGARVRVKSYQEILAMLDGANKTRGLFFDAEMVPFCGKELAVRSVVTQIVDERTGYMLRFKSPVAILESVCCQGTYSENRMFCPRSIYSYWRPVWLTPAEQPAAVARQPDCAVPAGATAKIRVQRSS